MVTERIRIHSLIFAIGNVAKVKMEDWCSLIEAFLQISILNSTFTENSTPLVSFIRKITIDPRNYKTEESEYSALTLLRKTACRFLINSPFLWLVSLFQS